MFRKVAAIALTTLTLAALAATPAFGWGNGGEGDGQVGDGYATHDWVLDHAINMAAKSGADTSWINVDVALQASDDPDYRSTQTSTYLHTYMEYGAAQGGPQTVADEYYKLMAAYRNGDYVTASRHLGVMSHYYSDITQPYHTDTRGASGLNGRHNPYEIDVSDLTRSYGQSTGWLDTWNRKDVTDVRASAVSAALYARSKYPALDASYRAHNSRVEGAARDITGYVLNRATNDLADIVAAIPAGKGLAQPPATMRQKMMKMTYYYPRRGSSFSTDKICSQTYCYDANGNPMRGVAVTFSWPFATGTKSYVAYTDANGLAYNWQAPGTGVPLMRRRTMTARSHASGGVATSATWYMPTPVLATAKAGVKTTIPNNRPKRNTRVKAYTRFRDTKGNAVAGLPVTFKWYFKSNTVTTKTVTNSKGYAYTSMNIGSAAKGHRVYVKGMTYSGRYSRSSRASFIPH